MQNLWTGLNNELTSPDSAGQQQKQEPLRRRRSTEQVILSSLRDWLLHGYVLPYCRILSATRIYRHCYWIDALGGIERHDENVASPTLQPILSLANRLAQENRPLALHGLVLQSGSSKRNETRAADGKHGGNNIAVTSAKDAGIPPRESGIVHASWLEIAGHVLNLIDQSPAIFLLNPFGHTLFTYDDLVPLYQRTAPTELCLFISHKQLETRITASHRTPAVASALTALLRSDRWKVLPINDDEMERTIGGVVDLLIASMQRHFSSVQHIAFPVQVRPAVVETAPYALIFATRRQDSLATMNDGVCLYRRHLYEQSFRGVLVAEWFATQQQERFAAEMQQLYQRTLQQGRTQRVRRWPDLRQQLLNVNFGHYTVHEHDEVIQQLLADGAVRCDWRRRPTEDVAVSEERRVPGSDDTLLWK
jgi:hypothetical protein